MPNLNTVFDVFKRHHPVANFSVGSGGFAWWEQVFNDLHGALSKRGSEIFKYEVWIGFRDCTTGRRWKVMSEVDIVQAERGRRTMRKV